MSRIPCIIRRASEKDCAAIAELTAELGYPALLDIIVARVRAISVSGDDLLLVCADAQDKPIAWLQAHAAQILESGFRVEIVGLIVSAEARRRGIGRSLLEEAERWAMSIKANTLVTRSDIKRTESHAFYPALGFNRTKTQDVYRKVLGGANHAG
jgi:ribosomal protein S18 acetylase RimI-like enzyme